MGRIPQNPLPASVVVHNNSGHLVPEAIHDGEHVLAALSGCKVIAQEDMVIHAKGKHHSTVPSSIVLLVAHASFGIVVAGTDRPVLQKGW